MTPDEGVRAVNELVASMFVTLIALIAASAMRRFWR
jgi:hypothetical protein